MLGFSRPAAPELCNVCYKSFSLNFGGDGAGGTEEEVLEMEFLAAAAFSSISVDFSLVLVLLAGAVAVAEGFVVFEVVAPLLCCCVFCCCCCKSCGAKFFDCQFTSSIETNFLRRSKY